MLATLLGDRDCELLHNMGVVEVGSKMSPLKRRRSLVYEAPGSTVLIEGPVAQGFTLWGVRI